MRAQETRLALSRARDRSSPLLSEEIHIADDIVRGRYDHRRFGSWEDGLGRAMLGWLKAQFGRSPLSIMF